MSKIDFDALSQRAQEAGYDTTELAPGTYDAEVANAKYDDKTSAKSIGQFGFRFKVLGGPEAGQGVWKNLNVPNDAASANQVGIFLREMRELGVDQALASVDPDAAAKQLLGRQFTIEVKRNRPKGNGGFWTDVNIKGAPAGGVPAPAPQSAQGGVAGGQTAPVVPAWQQGARPV